MIKNYIFDFGGVLYEINHRKTLEEFSRLSSRKDLFHHDNLDYFINYPLIRKYEKGMISTDEFRRNLKKEFCINTSDDEFNFAWNLTLIRIYPDTISVIQKYSKLGRIIILSNTSELHYKKFEPECRKLLSLFERCFFSFQIRIAKPDMEIFKYIINKTGFDKTETLFIDDSIKNIEAARKFGFNTFLFDAINREFPYGI